MYVIRERLFRLGEDSDITDEAGLPVLHVDGKVLSLHNRLILRDPAGREVGQVHRKLAALRCHRTQMGGHNPIAWITEQQAGQLLGVEYFRRALIPGRQESPLEALGETAQKSEV